MDFCVNISKIPQEGKKKYAVPCIKRLRAYTEQDTLYVTSHISGRGIEAEEDDNSFVAPKSSEMERTAQFGPVLEERNRIWN